ncbi:MAG TPA: ATP-binding protein [Pyrinomonadaceae bacterium]|nr:ATP-binding protein [Pyrinomonadaceae bacterium]
MEQVSLVFTEQAIASLRESDFDTASAVGEVIDNSIQAAATAINIQTSEVDLPVRGRRKVGATQIVEFAFGDNGKGMDEETLHHCMQLGYSTRYNDRSGIGRFGVGMTLAAINQCKRIEVYSRTEQSKSWLHTYVDLDENTPYIPPPVKEEPPQKYRHLVGKKHGTLVIWKKCDRLLGQSDEIKHWIGRTYRKFIGKHQIVENSVVKNPDSVAITYNNEKIEAFDPLYVIPNKDFPKGQHAELLEEISLEMPVPDDALVPFKTSRLIIRMSLTPKEWRLEGGGISGRSQLAQNLRMDDNWGISVLRANREVFYDIMPHFDPPPHPDGIDRWWSAEIAFEPVLDRYFSVRNIKRGARFRKELREEIETRIKPSIYEFRKQVQSVFKQTKIADIHKDKDVSTEHTEAEKTVKAAAPTPGKAGRDKTPAERAREIREIIEPLVKNEDELAAWVAKIEAQPCTIVDKEGATWKGDTFLDIHPQVGRTIIEYNMMHDFFMFVYGAIKELTATREKDDATALIENAKKLKVALDLLFMAYAQARSHLDPEHEQRVGDTIQYLENNWGMFLRQYLKTHEKNS